MKRKTSLRGAAFFYPIQYANVQGVGPSVADAQLNANDAQGNQFQVNQNAKYGSVSISGPAILSCADEGAFVDLLVNRTNSAINEMTNRLAFDLYRDGTGQRAQRASASTNVITLTDPDTARNFGIGMTVMASPNANGTSPRTGSTTVKSIQIAAGTVTLTSAAGITSFADNDYLFAGSSAGNIETGMHGMESCTPLTAPAPGDAFRTAFNRSVFPEMLAGSRLSATTGNIEDNAGIVAVDVDSLGGETTDCVLNPVNWNQVMRRLGAKIEYIKPGAEAMYGFETIVIVTSAGSLRVWSDPDCPTNRGRIFKSDSHYIGTCDSIVHILEDDGNRVLRLATSDGIEARMRSLTEYIQPDTRNHGVFQI